jgi:beta-lactamase class A
VDTTSPAAVAVAVAADLRSLLLGDVLSLRSGNQLTLCMEANLTGLERIRAKLPASWRVADKTGANGEHMSNDIADFWPAGKPPIVVADYITQCIGPESKRAAILVEIGELVKESFS